ncbi:hypothetical protein Q5P01_025976 [Channa striata]|uniref:Uncharacterized protein n=1 Tax=Channa striata TaxID=64152 RepID=A0AA88ITR5_CHASR|nr:hypothetical protein Q5P01_025976 [Channa striata]
MNVQPVVVDVSPHRRCSSPCHLGDHTQQRQGLARSQSDMLPPLSLTVPLLGTPARINPFSLRQDLNGGRCKLWDTPSKSVISLTFTLPALRDPCASPRLLKGTPGVRAPPRRCQSLPCTPELSRTVALSTDTERKEEVKSEDVNVAVNKGETEEGEEGQNINKTAVDAVLKMKLTEKEEGMGADLGVPVELEMVSLERLDEEDEEEDSVCVTEPMDCTKSPEPAERVMNSTSERPLLTSTSSFLRTSGWRLPISNGRLSLPPLPRLDNNNGSALVTGQQVHWGRGVRANGYNRPQVLSTDPSGPSEQGDVISCMSCCLVALSFPSMCLRGSAAVAAPQRRASLPRQRPYRNLNSTITGGSTPPTAGTANKALLCCSTNGLVVTGSSVPCEPGRSLPEA